ncbi:hypothetical protein L7F22_026653 [Adiantum nelumboides]|nr:hypothetical protein [Adiantum nelumboides]
MEEECPICRRLLPVTGLERHVNSHLDEAESARDRALALELASISHSPSVQTVDMDREEEIALLRKQMEEMQRALSHPEVQQLLHTLDKGKEKKGLESGEIPQDSARKEPQIVEQSQREAQVGPSQKREKQNEDNQRPESPQFSFMKDLDDILPEQDMNLDPEREEAKNGEVQSKRRISDQEKSKKRIPVDDKSKSIHKKKHQKKKTFKAGDKDVKFEAYNGRRNNDKALAFIRQFEVAFAEGNFKERSKLRHLLPFPLAILKTWFDLSARLSLADKGSWNSLTIACSSCNELVAVEEWESHSLMHEIQAGELKSIQHKNDVKCDEGEMPSKKLRVGNYASTSKSTLSYDGSRDVRSLVSSQRRGSYTNVEEGIMCLIEDCLKSERQGPSCTVISAHVNHFETCTSEDDGWGCGWRNIQMLSSHLLTHQWAKKVLFGGAGFVPDIPSLQQWLELAWAFGFDEPGAEFFQFRIHGSKEWIGTSECATLFRSFGLRARIVDFSAAGENVRKKGPATIDRWFQRQISRPDNAQRKVFDELPLNTVIHQNVECDGCGVYPIKGVRYKSRKKTNYDLCSSCIVDDDKLDDYERVVSSKSQLSNLEVARDEDVSHEALVKWVWNYFTDGIKDAASKKYMDLSQGHVSTSCHSPLYFQHQGHSRTIVGVQRRKKNVSSKEEVFLLVLDPSNKTGELLQALRCRKNWQRMIKRSVHTLKKRSYQVCYVEPGVVEGEELEQLKILRSEQFFD